MECALRNNCDSHRCVGTCLHVCLPDWLGAHAIHQRQCFLSEAYHVWSVSTGAALVLAVGVDRMLAMLMPMT